MYRIAFLLSLWAAFAGPSPAGAQSAPSSTPEYITGTYTTAVTQLIDETCRAGNQYQVPASDCRSLYDFKTRLSHTTPSPELQAALQELRSFLSRRTAVFNDSRMPTKVLVVEGSPERLNLLRLVGGAEVYVAHFMEGDHSEHGHTVTVEGDDPHHQGHDAHRHMADTD